MLPWDLKGLGTLGLDAKQIMTIIATRSSGRPGAMMVRYGLARLYPGTVAGRRANHRDHGMTQLHYTGTAKTLHWTAAVLIVCGFSLGLFMTGLEISPDKLRLYAWHKWIGITVFLIAVARVA